MAAIDNDLTGVFELPTIRQVAANTLSSLRAADIDAGEACAETQLILEHCLELDLAQQLIHAEQFVTAEKLARIDAICKQRAARIPLQYCLGYAYFWKMKLAVTPGVFIPRTDTEALVQIALEKIRPRKIKLIADIGTGSGAIAIALARELPHARVIAIDISLQALEVAKKNAAAFGVEQQISFKLGHWVSALSDDFETSNFEMGDFEMIVSNPPYLNNLDRVLMPPEITQHELETALFGPDTDGLGFYRELAKHAARYLNQKSGEVLLEIGDGQSESITNIFKAAGWGNIGLHKDLNGLTRVMSVLPA